MRYKNNKFIMGLLLILIIIGYVIAYFDNRLEYKIFLAVGMTISLIFIIFAIFEYYEVNQNSLIHVSKLGFEKEEALWKDINLIYLYPNRYFKTVRLRYGTLNEKEIVINTGVKNYKELIKIVLDKTKDNPQISVDIRVHELLK